MDNMMTSYEYDADNTVPQTLWSSTLNDILYDSLRMNLADKHVIAAIIGLQQKKYRTRDIVKKVKRKLGTNAANRVVELAGRIRVERLQ